MRRLLAAIIVFVCGCFIFVWQQNGAVRAGIKVTSLQSEYDKINAEIAALRLKLTSILSIDKMEAIAKEKNFYKAGEKEIERID
jgi:hypothetical protein